MMPCNINRTGKPFQCEFSMIKNARNDEITMYINIHNNTCFFCTSINLN